MSILEQYGDSFSLADQVFFEAYYQYVSSLIADRFGRRPKINPRLLKEGYEAWIISYRAEMRRTNDPRRRFLAALTHSVRELSTRRIIRYEKADYEANVTSHLVGSLLNYPSEVTALLFASVIYSQEMRRITNAEPNCTLTPGNVARVASELRVSPGKSKDFRWLLNLKSPRRGDG